MVAAFAEAEHQSGKTWTTRSNGATILGHSDRIGLREDDTSPLRNASQFNRAAAR